MTKLSIILTVYNNEKEIDKCFTSISNQSFNDFEVICINNGSHDKSIEILNKWKKQDNRFKIYNFKNTFNIKVLRNKMLSIVKGEYISFININDELDINHYANLLNNLIFIDNTKLLPITRKKLFYKYEIQENSKDYLYQWTETNQIEYKTNIPMEIVYVFDENYLKYFEISVKTVLKYNPNAHITVVSPKKLDIKYDNIVIPISENLKHRENDRITDATYLKLHLTDLPYNKILFIDADIICQGPLNELWNTECNYICLTESHSYGEIQAKEHNHEKYGLSGMMLMNLQALREDNFIEKAFIPFDYSPYKIWCHEETIINHYFYDKLTFVNKKFNYCHNRIYKEPILEKDAVLLHYCGGNKKDFFKHKIVSQITYRTLTDIKKYIKGKKVAIIGNALSIFDKENGSLIDSFDVVIRFTRGFISVPESQGSKTDIVILADVLTESELNSYKAKYYINRMKRIKNETKYYFENYDIVRISNDLNGARASSGLIAIDFCIESGCQSIDLFGFDWEKTPTFYNPIGYKTLHNYDSEENKVKNYYALMCPIKIN